MLTLIAAAIVVLTLLVIVLSLFIVLFRFLGDLHQVHVQAMRARMQQCLDEFLAGKNDPAHVLRELGADPGNALGVLIDTASRMPRDQRGQLLAFYEHFDFPSKELAALHARPWALRVRAATRLGYMGHDEPIPDLVRALEDPILDVRLAAARALAQLGAASAVRPILRALALSAAWPLQRCTEILNDMGSVVIDPLLTLLNERNPQDQDVSVVVAVRVLGMLRAEKAVDTIGRFLNSPQPELRLSCARALGQIGNSAAFTALTTALADPVWEVRSDAALALGRLCKPEAADPLYKALADPAWWVRFNAAESLYRLGNVGLTKLRVAMNNHVDAFARDISRQVLEGHGAIQAQPA